MAAQFAYQFPDRCERLVLVGSGGVGRSVSPLLRLAAVPGAELLMPLFGLPPVRTVSRLAAELLRQFDTALGRDAEEVLAVFDALPNTSARQAILRTLRSGVDWRGQVITMLDRAYLAEGIPTLSSGAGATPSSRLGHGRLAHAAMPGSELEIFDEAGHFPHHADPDRFAHSGGDFIGAPSRPGTTRRMAGAAAERPSFAGGRVGDHRARAHGPPAVPTAQRPLNRHSGSGQRTRDRSCADAVATVSGRHTEGRATAPGLRRSPPCFASSCPKARWRRPRCSSSPTPIWRCPASSDVTYRATIADPRIDEVRILRPQEIPVYVAEGLFDIGITGRDWIEERGSDVVSLGELPYAKATSNTVRVVLAVAQRVARHHAGRAGRPTRALRVSSEYPELTRKALAAHGIEADISMSYGATEAKVPDIADAVVDMTETGSALRAAGLRIIETLLVSPTELIANPAAAADPAKRHAMEQILTLLQGTLEARGKVLVKLNVAAGPARCRPRCAALHAGPDHFGALRRGRLRPRSRGGQVRHQHPHPGPQRPRGHRHPRDPAVQDRPLTVAGSAPLTILHLGRVTAFDARRRLGASPMPTGSSSTSTPRPSPTDRAPSNRGPQVHFVVAARVIRGRDEARALTAAGPLVGSPGG